MVTWAFAVLFGVNVHEAVSSSLGLWGCNPSVLMDDQLSVNSVLKSPGMLEMT